jgi:tetratricopeptide (TPR) repeat protein
MRKTCFIFAALLVLPAAAQNTGCVPYATRAASATIIQACTAIIEAGQAGKTELARVRANRSLAYLVADNLNGAEKDAVEALTLDPDLALAHFSRGEAYLHNNAVEAAMSEFDTTIRLDPGNGTAYNNRGTVKARIGSNEAAIADFSQAIKLNPNAPGYYANRSAVLQRLGRFAEAAPDADRLTVLAPGVPASWNSACWAHAIWGQELETALADCDKAVAMTATVTPPPPPAASFLDSRCLVKYRMEKYDAAVEDCTAALKINPRLAAALYVRGLALMKSGHRGDGADDVAAARRLGVDVQEVYARYGVKP